VENIGTSTLIWKKENRIISAGQVIIRKVGLVISYREAKSSSVRWDWSPVTEKPGHH
jgi:hypothetical protein